MNWADSQMASAAFAQGQGGMSPGEQWALAALMRDAYPDDPQEEEPDEDEEEK